MVPILTSSLTSVTSDCPLLLGAGIELISHLACTGSEVVPHHRFVWDVPAVTEDETEPARERIMLDDDGVAPRLNLDE
jgi:hypothetical protein